MRRILSLPGLAVAAWASSLALLVLLAGMLAGRAWHPHFLPVSTMLALVIAIVLALVVGASWRIVRGPGRRRALAWLLIGAAPLWFLAGYFLYGLMIGSGRKIPVTLPLKMLATLGESVMDLEARFRYPQRTAGEKVVMFSAPMPEAEARAQVAAMDRHVRALEARLGRPTRGTVHWARGPLLGIERHAVFGLCMGTRPGEEPPDAEGLGHADRHEVAHCVLTSHCSPRFDPPAVLTEGWAQANQGDDPIEQANRVGDAIEQGNGLTLRQLTGPDWYDRHEWPVYQHGAPLVDFLLRRFGPEKFLALYSTCRPATFEDDCRRILGLDLDGLDAAFRADVERMLTQAGSLARRRLERLRLGPGVDADAWKAFLAEYFAVAERLLAPYRHVRLTSIWTWSETDAQGQTREERYEERLLRSGEFASLRRRSSGSEQAFLAHPRRSILARRDTTGGPWQVVDESKRTPEQSRHRALDRIKDMDQAGRWAAIPLAGVAEHLARLVSNDQFLVAAFERFDEGGRPRVRVRIEDRSPADSHTPWREMTFVLAADDLFAIRSVQTRGISPGNNGTYESRYTYDSHEGIPVLRSERTVRSGPDGEHATSELKVVDRRFGPIAEEEFDPDRFLDGPQVTEPRHDPFAAEPSMLARFYWLPFPIGAFGLIAGVVMSLGTRRDA